jgi:predicted component of type VI protein secretion system
MKLILVEERNGQQRPERAFDQQTIKVGRDPAECTIVFDQAEWPMVSRKHAEFRLKDGRYLLVDTNSSFGTFLNGQRVSEPVEIQAGARVQFGAGGPVMLIARIEQATAPKAPAVEFAEMETRRDFEGVQPVPGKQQPGRRHSPRRRLLQHRHPLKRRLRHRRRPRRKQPPNRGPRSRSLLAALRRSKSSVAQRASSNAYR